MSYFTGRTHLGFDELPDFAQKKIKEIIRKNKYTDLDVHQLDIRVIPFYGDDLKNRYKEIKAIINEFLDSVNIDLPGINTDIMQIWQRDLFQNATQIDTTIDISKEKLIWPLIVLVVDRKATSEYTKDFDDDEIEYVQQKYKLIINQNTLSYNMISRVITDYERLKGAPKEFVEDHWMDYMDIIDSVEDDEKTKESLIKIILYRVLMQKKYIRNIKRGTNL